MSRALDQTVAYVIVCWNNIKLLNECIESIQKQTNVKQRIILVDNASSDGSAEHVTEKYPDVEVLVQTKNHAFAKGNNIGIEHALKDPSIKYIALVNTDATLDSHWTETILRYASLKTKVAALQTITLDYYNHEIIDSTHIYIAHNGQGTQGSWRRDLISGTDVAPQKIFGCNAAAVIYTREFIESQPFKDFFDETMWMYLEDVDVAARATVMGWDNYVVPGARAYHMGSASSTKNPGFSLYLTYRNNLGLLVKNLPLIILIKMAPRVFMGDIRTIQTLKRTGRSKLIKLVIKGRIASLVTLPNYLFKRNKVKRVLSWQAVWRLMAKGF